MQLALDNALAPFFENNFGFGITKAANLAAIFGMMNFFARPLSGLFSDLIARRWGMRGRLWWLWCCVAGGGASCPGSPNLTWSLKRPQFMRQTAVVPCSGGARPAAATWGELQPGLARPAFAASLWHMCHLGRPDKGLHL